MAVPLALPSGRSSRPRNLLNVATLVLVTGGTALFAALIAAYVGLTALFGLVGVLMALARTIGRQFNSTNNQMLRATAWIWDFVVVCWIAVFATIWLFT